MQVALSFFAQDLTGLNACPSLDTSIVDILVCIVILNRYHLPLKIVDHVANFSIFWDESSHTDWFLECFNKK